jgi:hypothetical protein
VSRRKNGDVQRRLRASAAAAQKDNLSDRYFLDHPIVRANHTPDGWQPAHLRNRPVDANDLIRASKPTSKVTETEGNFYRLNRRRKPGQAENLNRSNRKRRPQGTLDVSRLTPAQRERMDAFLAAESERRSAAAQWTQDLIAQQERTMRNNRRGASA